ncbi:MAG: PKD domain-containing protein, partial [Pseudomonadota bacterium]
MLLIVAGLPGLSSVALAAHDFTLDSAEIRGNGELRVAGHVPQRGDTVAVRILDQNGAAISTADQGSKGFNWTFKEKPAPVPACVAEASLGGTTLTRDIANRPAVCEQQQNNPPVCSIDTPATDVTITVGGTVNYSATVTDPDAGDVVTISWVFEGGTPANSSAEDPGNVTYDTVGTFTTTLDATDDSGAPNAACVQQTRTITVEQQQAQCIPVTNGVSINSTSQDGCPEQLVPEQPLVLNSNFRVLAINDLGMHCGDLDTRISSILPPFQVLLGQVIERGATPTLNPLGVNLEYSAATNPNDPILGMDPNVVQRGVKADGSTYKTNFWDAVAGGAYDPFYPGGLG